MKKISTFVILLLSSISFGHSPVNASIRYHLEEELKLMLLCNDGDPYIYAHTSKVWNKAYSKSTFTSSNDGINQPGECSAIVLDINDEFPSDLPGYKVLRGSKASEAHSAGWDILFNKLQNYGNPSTYKRPQKLPIGCIDEIDNIPISKFITYCFR